MPLIIVSERSGISASAGPQTVALAGSRPRYTIKKLKNQKAPGIDDIPGELLKQADDSVAIIIIL